MARVFLFYIAALQTDAQNSVTVSLGLGPAVTPNRILSSLRRREKPEHPLLVQLRFSLPRRPHLDLLGQRLVRQVLSVA